MTKFSEEQLAYLNHIEFENNYRTILTHRLTDSSLEMENIDIYNAVKIYDNSMALRKMFKKLYSDDKILTEDFIIDIANTINNDAMYISNGYRKLGDSLEGNENIPIAKPDEIKKDMEKLLYDYYNTWKDLDIFEREARFNIEFLRIHPFEDGNGRTSRLLLCFNLINQGHVPVIITPNYRESYFEARNNSNVSFISDMFRKLSNDESLVIDSLIDQYKQIYLEEKNTKVKI